MLSFRSAFLVSAPFALALAFALACSDDATSSELGAPDDGGASPLIQDARAGSTDGGGTPVSTMRFAHVAPGVGPVDFCYQAARGGAAIGPVLGGGVRLDAGADADADAASVEPEPTDADVDAGPGPRRAVYRTVTKYLSLETTGAITFMIVSAGSTSCANPLVQADVTLDPGKLATVVLFGRPGDAGAELELAAFTDDRKTEADKARVRVIHAALGRTGRPAAGALAAYAVGAVAVPLAARVEPRQASTSALDASVDELGYATAAPLPNPAAIAIEPLPTDGGLEAGVARWNSADAELDLRGDSLHTAFVLSARLDANNAESPWFEVLWCTDTTTDGDQTTCARLR